MIKFLSDIPLPFYVLVTVVLIYGLTYVKLARRNMKLESPSRDMKKELISLTSDLAGILNFLYDYAGSRTVIINDNLSLVFKDEEVSIRMHHPSFESQYIEVAHKDKLDIELYLEEACIYDWVADCIKSEIVKRSNKATEVVNTMVSISNREMNFEEKICVSCD